MSKTKKSPSDFSFLQKAGFKVQRFNGNLRKRSSRMKNKEETTKLNPQIFLKYLPRPEEESNDTFKQDFQEFEYRVPQLKTMKSSNINACRQQPTKACKVKIMPQEMLTQSQRFRIKLKTAFENLKRSKNASNKQESQETIFSQPFTYNDSSSISLSLSQHLSRSRQLEEIQNQNSTNFQNSQQNVNKLKLPKIRHTKKQSKESNQILKQIEQMQNLVQSERLNIKSELKKIDAIKRQYKNQEAICQQVKKKKKAIKKYLRLLSFQKRGYASSDHDDIKKCLISIIQEEIILHRPKVKQHKLQKQQAQRDFQLHIEDDFQNKTFEVKRVMTRRIVSDLSMSDDIQKLQLLQLKTDFKADKVKKQSNSHKSSQKLNNKKKKKKKHHKMLNDSSETFQLNTKKESINIKYDSLLLQSLPVRNPTIKHQYNSQDNKQISFITQLTRGTLFYTSDILSFNSKDHTFSINCKARNRAFIEESIKSTKHCRTLIPPVDSETKRIKLKRNFEYTNKKILILDLDETLIHSQGLNEVPNKTLFPFSFDFQKFTRHYAIRNYAIQLIKNLSQMFYIVVFTSAVQGYADHILQHLDPQQKYVQHRLYRSNCYLHGQGYPYIKDLRLLNRDLSQVIIVDNSLYAYWFQVDNGVPIIPFLGEQDWQLKRLEKYLTKLQNVDDIREVNRRTFHMHLYQELDNANDVLQKYCELMNDSLKSKQ